MNPVRRSFERAKQANFAAHFYETFLASSVAIRVKFERTDFERQRELLLHGVYSMLDYAEGKAMGKMAMERLARIHGPSQLAITPFMYERWLDTFVATIAKVDPECDPALEAAWREALRPGISAISQHVTAAAPRSQRR